MGSAQSRYPSRTLSPFLHLRARGLLENLEVVLADLQVERWGLYRANRGNLFLMLIKPPRMINDKSGTLKKSSL